MSSSVPPQPKPQPTLADIEAQYPFPDYQAHIQQGVVTVEELATAFFNSNDERLDSKGPPGYRFLFTQYYQRLREAYEKAHGIKRIFWAGSADSVYGSVVTGDDEIIDLAPAPVESTLKLYQLMWDCERLGIEARRNLQGKPRDIVVEMIFEVITNLMGTLAAASAATSPAPPTAPQTTPTSTAKSMPVPTTGSPTTPPPQPQSAFSDAIVTFYTDQVQKTQDYYQKMATRGALSYYLIGAAVGVGIVGFLVGILVGFHLLGTSSTSTVDALAAFVSGAAGGTVGVMSRLVNADQSVTVDYEAPKNQVVLAGLFRPVVGGVLGTAFFAAAFSGLIPLMVPSDTTKALAFYAFVAFIGGLAERWAQDTLVQSGEGIFGTAGKTKSTSKGTGNKNPQGASTTGAPPAS
jgi:hypothetical protein